MIVIVFCFQACHDLEIFIDAYKKDNAWLVQELNSQCLKALSEKTAYEKRISGICSIFHYYETDVGLMYANVWIAF